LKEKNLSKLNRQLSIYDQLIQNDHLNSNRIPKCGLVFYHGYLYNVFILFNFPEITN